MVGNPPENLGRVTDPTPPPQSAGYTIAPYGRSGLADSAIPPIPRGPAPHLGASPPRGGFRSTLLALPGKSRPCAVHSTRVRSCLDSSQTPAPPGGDCPGNISRHRCLKGSAFRSEHFRTRQSQVFDLGRTQGRNSRGRGEQHDQAQWLNKWKPNSTSMGIAFLGNHLGLSRDMDFHVHSARNQTILVRYYTLPN
ncbi:hypothetical protein SAMN05421882_11341 [Nitrosomonas communis]|uniref:Uncharacterized protein n=1 Tax=Nitrosomonas communis TaxID=44574 RepID=A0A1H3AE58_9PROT|nr:hypothetical protein SAMN05421882_11341 [Nitrosomonas communis]